MSSLERGEKYLLGEGAGRCFHTNLALVSTGNVAAEGGKCVYISGAALLCILASRCPMYARPNPT